MNLSSDWIYKHILEPFYDNGFDSAAEYGEPGYSFDNDETPIFIIGHWWCSCGKHPHAGRIKSWGRDGETIAPGDLHDIASHHPRLWAQLESQGVECAFDDEWWIDHETSKAYRTTANSYHWQSSIQWNEDICEYMTPDDDPEVWIEWALNDNQRCLMADHAGNLKDAGFTVWEPDDPHRYESGWHPGQTDDPKVVEAQIREALGDVDIVFLLDETSQFYVGFSAWTRPTEGDEK